MRSELLDLGTFLTEQRLDAALVAPGAPMPTVERAAEVMACEPERIFKSVLFQSRKGGGCAMAIACGRWRVDVGKLSTLTGVASLRLASSEVVLAVTGYPAGGTPPIGHRERFPVVVDVRVAAQEWGYGGGGREELLVRIRSGDIVRLTQAQVADVVREE